jgi:hypothetical protein
MTAGPAVSRGPPPAVRYRSPARPEGALANLDAVRKRWFSRRALLLHLEFAVLVCGCLAAGWWQATRALGGNGLSWFYTFEWPAFALVAIAAWWHLIHESPEAYRARKQRSLVRGSPERSTNSAEW